VNKPDVGERSLAGEHVLSCAMGQLIDMADWELLPLIFAESGSEAQCPQP
jgi:hypothetical protein